MKAMAEMSGMNMTNDLPPGEDAMRKRPDGGAGAVG